MLPQQILLCQKTNMFTVAEKKNRKCKKYYFLSQKTQASKKI